MDDGRLTDSKGRVVDFRNTILILTSNVGADILLHDAAKHTKKEGADILLHDSAKHKHTKPRISSGARKEVLKRLRAHFLPEFLNRLDDVITFAPLSTHSLTAILQHQVRPLFHLTVSIVHFYHRPCLTRSLLEEEK